MTKQLFKFAGAVLDCYDDPAFVDSVQAKSYFGKTLVEPHEVDTLPDDAFAVKIASQTGYKRRFPVYNETVTKISCHYFNNAYDSLPIEIQESAGANLARACDKFGIQKVASISRHAASLADRTVDFVTKEASRLLVDESSLTKEAEMRLACELPKMPWYNRVHAATSFYKTAGINAITRQDVWDYVEKPVTGPLLEGALDDREEAIKVASPEVLSMFDNIRSSIDDLTPVEVIDTLVAFDKYAQLDDRYRAGLTDPQKAVYGGWTTPAARERNKRWEQEKVAEVIDGTTGQAVPAEAARGMSVQQHLYSLQKRFPKGTESFSKAASAGISPNMEQKWGPNYTKARKIYFGV